MNNMYKKMRMRRLEQELSQENLAEMIGISTAAYSKIERGMSDISISRLLQICKILNINPASLFAE